MWTGDSVANTAYVKSEAAQRNTSINMKSVPFPKTIALAHCVFLQIWPVRNTSFVKVIILIQRRRRAKIPQHHTHNIGKYQRLDEGCCASQLPTTYLFINLFQLMRFIWDNITGENALETEILSTKLSNAVDSQIWIISDTLLGEHRTTGFLSP